MLDKSTAGHLAGPSTELELVNYGAGACPQCGAAFPPVPMPLKGLPLAERFMARVHVCPASECWFWRGRRDQAGYGRLSVNNRTVRAHRVSFELHCGPIHAGAWCYEQS